MKPLTALEQAYWQKYVSTLSHEQRLQSVWVEASYAGNREITDDLLELYLLGQKTAGSSIVEDFVTAGEPLPKVGNHWIFLNSKSEPCCILKTEKIVIHKFKDIPEEIAIAEGEGDKSLSYWKAVHAELYVPHLAGWGVAEISEANVITEFFKIVYK